MRSGEVGVELTSVFEARDRKSTRLNSSHANISYAVFCLKKKNKQSTLNLPPYHTSHTHSPTSHSITSANTPSHSLTRSTPIRRSISPSPTLLFFHHHIH